jgi:hypothetical protein
VSRSSRRSSSGGGLDGAFGRFDRADAWRALLATTSLFHDLSRRVAEAILGDIRSFEPRIGRC